jgi:hypothetical protein
MQRIALALFVSSGVSVAQVESVNDGTDPTRLATSLTVTYKHTEFLTPDSTGLFELEYSRPVGAKRMSLGGTLPYGSGVTDSDFALGDASIKFVHVVDLNPQRGLAYTAEVYFDTAGRDELGTGQTVLELSAFYAKFLKSGAIFAPALVQRVNLSDNKNRPSVNSTTVDFYYVPRLGNPKYLMTLDPAVVDDHRSDRLYASLTVTIGRLLGKHFGGDAQVFIKPQLLGGGERPIDWSLQIGYKVLGF